MKDSGGKTNQENIFLQLPRNRWFSIVGSLIALLGLVVFSRSGAFSHQGPDASQQAYLQRQAAALKDDAQGDLDRLQGLPMYTIQGEVDPQAGVVSARLTVTYTNPSQQPLEEVVFRLYPNAQTIYGGGSLDVDQVWVDGQAITTAPAEDATILAVPLPEPLAVQQQTTIEMSFTTQVPQGFRQGYGILSRHTSGIVLAGWYPVLAPYRDGWETPAVPVVGDALAADTSLYEVVVRMPASTMVAATGVEVAGNQEDRTVVQNDGWRTWHFTSGPVREFALAASDQYEIVETDVDGVRLRLLTLPASSANTSAQAGLDLLAQAFATYEDWFGPYPYADFEAFETPISIGGYEFSGLAAIDEDLRPHSSLASYRYILYHELAHQWWYGLTGTPTVTEPWLDEAHATYATILVLEEERGPGGGDWQVSSWRREVNGSRLREPLDSPALDFTNWTVYRQSIYLNGALFIDTLRAEMGDDDFRTLLQRFQETYRYGSATTDDYLDLAEEVEGRDLDFLYQKWFDETTGEDER